MDRFLSTGKLPDLFEGYWQQYISQFPEAVFGQVNENFYRATFYELCRRYLSRGFIFTLEHSLAAGRTDFEMAGRHGTPQAGKRYLVEFKYISNAEARRRKLDLEDFQARDGDKAQASRYLAELVREHPNEQISGWLAYCFGNRGYRLFPVRLSP